MTRPVANLGTAVEALRLARSEVVGSVYGVDYPALVRAGWTPAGYRWISRLAEHALSVEAAICQHAVAVANSGAVPCSGLAEGSEWAVQDAGVPWSVVTPWLPVLAAEPDGRRAGMLRDWLRDSGALVAPIEVWAEQVGDLGPLAWAAGLSLAEAQARTAGGALSERGLRTLIGLRGVRLPDFEPAESA